MWAVVDGGVKSEVDITEQRCLILQNGANPRKCPYVGGYCLLVTRMVTATGWVVPVYRHSEFVLLISDKALARVLIQ